MAAAPPLIAGAGPVGLGAALFLARQGCTVRLIEPRREPSRESRALAVNPRTLDLLEPTGVTDRMLARGLRIRGVHFNLGPRRIGALCFDGVHPRHPYMLALSQASTERLLADAFEQAGGRIERGTSLTTCRPVADGVEASVETGNGGAQTVTCPWLLAADGAHSTAREQLDVEFNGSSFRREWHLVDAPIRTSLAEDHAHVFFFPSGAFLFLLRVVDDALDPEPGESSRDPVWRAIANHPDPLSRFVHGEQTGEAQWSSSFHISHRLNATFAAGRIFFAGDAAHIHSPIGARGMNLGLEDAWVFAALAGSRRLADYDGLRRPVDRKVVRRVEFLSRIPAGESPLFRFVRRYLFPVAISIPPVRRRMRETMTGLDHDVQTDAGRARA